MVGVPLIRFQPVETCPLWVLCGDIFEDLNPKRLAYTRGLNRDGSGAGFGLRIDLPLPGTVPACISKLGDQPGCGRDMLAWIQEGDCAFLTWHGAYLDEGFAASVNIPGDCHQLDGKGRGSRAGCRHGRRGELRAWHQGKDGNSRGGAGGDGGICGVGRVGRAADELGDLQLIDRNFGYHN